MSLLDTILNASGGDALQQVARRGGLSKDETTEAVSRMLPALTDRLRSNANQEGGLQALFGALGKGAHQRYLDEPTNLAEEATVEDGNKILGHLLGDRDGSRQVAAQVAADSGVDVGAVKRMLPLVATLAMGALSKQGQSNGLMQMFSGAGLGSIDTKQGQSLLDGLLGGESGSAGGGFVADLAKRFLV